MTPAFFRRNQSGHRATYRAYFINRETAMKIAKIIMAGTAALTIISFGGCGPTSAYGNGYQS